MKSNIATQPANHRSPWRTLLGMVVVLSIVHALSAQAVITVSSLDDSGPGTLRQAIADASPGDAIDFAVTGTITLTNGELVITNNLTINGPGATNLTISGNNASRVLSFGGVTAAISAVTIANGYASGGGGGIVNGSSTLTVSNCTLTRNAAGGNSWGGGVINAGTLIVIDSTIFANRCDGGGFGGGIYSEGSLFLTNSTVSGNDAAYGGGINLQASSVIIVGSTICSNRASARAGVGGGVLVQSGNPPQVLNSLIAGNSAGSGDGHDFRGTLNSLDYNLIGNTNGFFFITGVTTHNIYGKDPLLGPLADNGGPTPTHALLLGSPAIDQGSSGGLATDQRGQPRIFNFPAYFDAADGSDIGAYELQERPQTGPVFTVNSNDDVDDGIPGIAHCSLREAINAANANADTNTINFATGVTGMIALTNGQLTINNSVNINGPGAANLTVSGNNSNRVFSLSGVPYATISGLTIANGSAADKGGGIFSLETTLRVSDCAIAGNHASVGGAIGQQGGDLTVLRSTISANGSINSGGGIDVTYGTLKLLDSAVIGNGSGGTYGGGIFIAGTLLMTNSTVSSNFGEFGGGICAPLGESFIVNSTISSNSASQSGGGIYFTPSRAEDKMILRNTLVAGNSAPNGPDCSSPISPLQPITSLDYNLIQNTNGCTITNLIAHNIYNLDPKLGPLADNGGPTPTHALLPDSPAIDQGSSGGLATDQRGLPRIFNFPAYFDAADGSDIGAYELQERAQSGPVFTVNSSDDVDNGIPGIAHCSLREAINAANANSDTNTIDFAAEVPGLHTGVTGTITLANGQLTVTNSVNINGPGAANLTVSGNNASRVFNLSSVPAATINELTIADGNVGFSGWGGGISSGLSTLTLNKCTVTGNKALFGGGVLNSYGTLTIIDSTISSNVAASGSGADGAGGGIASGVQGFDGGTLNIIRSTIFSNGAGDEGGGVYSTGLTMLTNSTVSGNSVFHPSPGAGGGITIQGTGVIASSTICSNNGIRYGGGIDHFNGQLEIMDSIVAGNSAGIRGPDVASDAVSSLDYNLIGNTNGAVITGVTTHNIYGKDPLLGPLADNGGPTATHALLPGSPAIDQGSSAGLATDQRGQPRVFNFPAYSNADDGSDIGAYELQERAQTGPVFTVNSNDDADDGIPGIAHCSLREAIAHAAPGATIDFAATGTITLTNGQLVIDKDLTVSGPGATNLTVSGNNAHRVFEIKNATVALSGLSIADGFSSGGGGILSESSSTLTLSSCTITNCRSTGSAGGIYSGWPNCALRLVNTAVQGNRADFFAGGVYAEGAFSAFNSTFSSNTSVEGGGGLWIYTGGGLTNCTISGNSDDTRAGGILCYPGPTTLISCSVVSNSAGEGPGGIEVLPGVAVSLQNTIIANNTAAGGFGADASGILNSLDYNLVGDTNGASFTNLTAHNIYGQDPLVGPLAENGGSTMTHALLPGSPAIDAGHSGGLTTDQRGQARPVDFPAIANAGGGDGSDIGAYEVRDIAQTGPVFTVNSTDDTDDGVPGVLHCSLREAIAYAAPGDTIDFAVTGTITLTNGQLVITNNLTITGPGRSNLSVSGNDASRVFNINSAGAVVVISGLAIINGNPGTDDGGGIRNLGNLTISNCIVSHCTAMMVGAGILSGNSSTLRVVNSIVSYNSCWSGGAWGAAIACPWYDIRLTIINSTISSNYHPTAGGAIMLGNGGVGAITNSTVSGNATGGEGGGLYLQYAASLSVDSCTISGNTAGTYGGGGIANYAGATVIGIRNSVIAGNNANFGPDCWGSIVSLDYNLIQNTNGCTITGDTTHNIYGQDPLLGPLADNGGPTPTHAILPGSPAIDHGSSGGLATDQRGQPRIFNFPAYFDAADGSDIGAYELQECAQTGPVFTVNSNEDMDDGVPGIAHCSLREAINAANANSDSNSITFATSMPGLMSGVTGTILLTNGQLQVLQDLSLTGPGASNLIISGNHASRVFEIGSLPLVNCPSVTLSGLAVADGKANGDYGGGIFNLGKLSLSDCVLKGNTADQSGGAIYHTSYRGGTLTIVNSVLHNNAAASGVGGAICNSGWAAVVGSCIFSNNASNGGGIWGVFGGSSTCLTNTTISGNVATDSAGAIGMAIDSTVFVDSCTICSNSAGRIAGGIQFGGDYDDVFAVRNSIVAGNMAPSAAAGPDVYGMIISGDFNLIQNPNSEWGSIVGVTTHNIYNQDPKLGPLADLAGPTPTHALRYDSPALDAGNSGGLTTDQRGLPRPIDGLDIPNAEGGDGSDIGAFEADPNLRITEYAKVGSDIWLQFSSMFGRNYRVESADNITGPWNVFSNNIPGTGISLEALDEGGAVLPQRFYRVAIMP